MKIPPNTETSGVVQGLRADIIRFLRNNPGRHYTYVLRRPNGEPFYIGKGRAYRCLHHERDSKNESLQSHKLNIIRELVRNGRDITYEIDSFHETETMALARERELIKAIGRLDLKTGILTNLTDGGEGASNWSDETRARHLNTLGGTEDDGSDRSVTNRFVAKFSDNILSKTLKPLATYKPTAIRVRADRINPSPRQAASLAASAVANGIPLESGCRIPRLVTIDGIPSVIENGVCGSLVGAGLATIAPGSKAGAELLILSQSAVAFIISQVGEEVLRQGGVIP